MTDTLVFKGSLYLAPIAATPTFVDVSSEVTSGKLSLARADVGFPATLAGPKSHGAGAITYTIDIGHFSTDGTTGLLFPMLWTAILTDDKQLYFRLKFRDGVTSTTNPEWQGTLVVSGADLGGDVGSLSAGSITCTLVSAPVRDTTP